MLMLLNLRGLKEGGTLSPRLRNEFGNVPDSFFSDGVSPKNLVEALVFPYAALQCHHESYQALFLQQQVNYRGSYSLPALI